jgi:phosphoglycerate dehydrogenase-like enzyme
MKIGLLLKFEEEEIQSLKKFLPEHDILSLNVKSDDLYDQLSDIEVLIGANVSDEMIAASKKLRLFHVPWVGLDRINFEALQKKEVIICNSKWNHKIVAEFALSLLLAGLKNLIPIHNDFSKGSWALRSAPSKLLSSSNVLLIGFGSIGTEIAKLLIPFTKNVIALRNDPNRSTQEEKQLVKKIIGWDKYLDEIGSIDYIINSLPLTPHTINILTKDRIMAMKKGAFYVSVGRGKTTDEKALYEVLLTKHLAGAAIDVWYNYKSSSDTEPFFPSNCPFHQLDNVIMSPHRASTFADTSIENIFSDIVFNINALASKTPLKNIISYEKRY